MTFEWFYALLVFPPANRWIRNSKMSFATHLEQQITENLAAGMSPEDARYSALRALGGMTQIDPT